MKKRNVILQAAIAATFLSASFAQAGTIATGNINYAAEAVGTATPLTLGSVVYTLGVARSTTQPFTIIYTLTGASNPVFNATPLPPTPSGTCAVVGSSLKRGGIGSNQVVFDIVVSAPCTAGDTLTLLTPAIRAATATAGITVQLLDTGETACVDNAGTPTTCIVTSTPRASLVGASGFGTAGTGTVSGLAAPPADTGTIVDVNATVPLAGFLAQTTTVANDKDTATVARAVLAVTNTSLSVQNAANTAPFTLAAGDLVTLSLSDATGFLGLAASGLCFDTNASAVLNGTTTPCETGEVFTVSGNAATLASIPGNSAGFSGVGQTVSYTSNATTAMGTTRTIGVQGSVTPTASGGATRSYVGNASWWSWTSNGTVLQSPMFQNTSGFLSRFALSNTGTSSAAYSVSILTETGNACTTGALTGTIPANGLVVIDGSSICTAFVGGAPRGTAIFTVSAPSTNIQGLHQNVSPGPAFAVSSVVMRRPGTN